MLKILIIKQIIKLNSKWFKLKVHFILSENKNKIDWIDWFTIDNIKGVNMFVKNVQINKEIRILWLQEIYKI